MPHILPRIESIFTESGTLILRKKKNPPGDIYCLNFREQMQKCFERV